MLTKHTLSLSWLFLVFSSTLAPVAWGHGRMIEPPSRSSMWRFGFDTPTNYEDTENFCGGFTTQWSSNGGKCGICGDNWVDSQPRANEAGGKYGNGVIVRTYKKDSSIKIKIDLTANHKGHFEFSICPQNNPKQAATQGCFDKYPLKQTNGKPQYDVNKEQGNKILELDFQLPTGLTCTHCIVMWRYRAGNNYGNCDDGSGAVGCGPQEEFRACSDVVITESDTQNSPLRPTCHCVNPFSGTLQAFAGSKEVSCENHGWCNIYCDSTCGDNKPSEGFFSQKGRCVSKSACGTFKKSVVSNPPAIYTPPPPASFNPYGTSNSLSGNSNPFVNSNQFSSNFHPFSNSNPSGNSNPFSSNFNPLAIYTPPPPAISNPTGTSNSFGGNSNPFVNSNQFSSNLNPFSNSNPNQFSSNFNPFSNSNPSGTSNPFGGNFNPFGNQVSGSSNPFSGNFNQFANSNPSGTSNPIGGNFNPFGNQVFGR